MNKTQAIKEAKISFKNSPGDKELCRFYLESPFEEIRQFALKQIKMQEEERERLNSLLEYEKALWNKGFKLVAGVDEVGRGPLAGPVVAGAVIFPPNMLDLALWGLNDSKKLSEKKRRSLEPVIKEKALAWGIAWQNQRQIDRLNIVKATEIAMEKALKNLARRPDYLLADGKPIGNFPYKQQFLIKGDSLSLSIAAASVLAKCFRDRLMAGFDKSFPQYQFAKNKGYGSAAHCAALAKWGPSPLHRRSFIVKGLLK